MDLTGKCKIDFEKWFNDKYLLFTTRVEQKMFKLIEFYDSPQSMQYGVYVDFFASVDLHIYVYPYFDFDRNLLFKNNILLYKDIDEQNSYSTNYLAQIKVIKRANEIYNNQ